MRKQRARGHSNLIPRYPKIKKKKVKYLTLAKRKMSKNWLTISDKF